MNLALAKNCCHSHRLQKWREYVDPNSRYLLLTVFVTFGLPEKLFSGVFWEDMWNKHEFLGTFLTSRFVFFTYQPRCQRLEPCSSETSSAKHHLAFAEFSDEQNSFSSYVLFELRIVTLNLRCFFYWFFSSKSPRILLQALWYCTTVVNDVIKWLSILVSHALSTLASMLFLGERGWSLFTKGQVKMISFFHRPWHLSVVHLIISKFLCTYWSDLSIFFITITAGSRCMLFQYLARRKFFSDLSAEKSQISDLF